MRYPVPSSLPVRLVLGARRRGQELHRLKSVGDVNLRRRRQQGGDVAQQGEAGHLGAMAMVVTGVLGFFEGMRVCYVERLLK